MQIKVTASFLVAAALIAPAVALPYHHEATGLATREYYADDIFARNDGGQTTAKENTATKETATKETGPKNKHGFDIKSGLAAATAGFKVYQASQKKNHAEPATAPHSTHTGSDKIKRDLEDLYPRTVDVSTLTTDGHQVLTKEQKSAFKTQDYARYKEWKKNRKQVKSQPATAHAPAPHHSSGAVSPITSPHGAAAAPLDAPPIRRELSEVEHLEELLRRAYEDEELAARMDLDLEDLSAREIEQYMDLFARAYDKLDLD